MDRAAGVLATPVRPFLRRSVRGGVRRLRGDDASKMRRRRCADYDCGCDDERDRNCRHPPMSFVSGSSRTVWRRRCCAEEFGGG